MSKNKPQKNIDILKRFSIKANELSDDKYGKLCKFGITINVNNKEGKVINNFPNDEIIKSFLMNIRMFIMSKKNSDFNFEKTCFYFVKNEFMSEEVKKWLIAYNNIFNREVFKLRINNRTLTTKNIFHTILNEDNFHQEMEQKGMNIIKSHPLIESFSRINFFEVLCALRLILCAFNKQIVEEYLNQYDRK